jgi:hypothetical protein
MEVREAQIGSAQRELLWRPFWRRRGKNKMVAQFASAFVVSRAQKRWVLCCLRRSASSLRRRRLRGVKVADKNSSVYEECRSRLKLGRLGHMNM